MKNALKVSQKLDMFGIGAAHQKDPNGIAWKQNKDFEAVLRRLNQTSDDVSINAEVETIAVAEEDVESKRKRDKADGDGEKSKKKRKRSTDGEERASSPVPEEKATIEAASVAAPVPRRGKA